MQKKEDLKKLIGKKIAKLRKGIGLSQETFSEKASISMGGLRDIERGKNFPKAENILNIANALSVEPYELFIPVDSNPYENCYENLLGLLEMIKENDSQIIATYKFVKSIITHTTEKN